MNRNPATGNGYWRRTIGLNSLPVASCPCPVACVLFLPYSSGVLRQEFTLALPRQSTKSSICLVPPNPALSSCVANVRARKVGSSPWEPHAHRPNFWCVGAGLSTMAVAQQPPPVSSAAGAAPDTSSSSPPGSSEEEAKRQAKERFEHGKEFYRDGAFAAALVEFRKAYGLSANWRVLYNIGQVCYQIQDFVCALASFDDYLAKGGANVENDRRAEVEQESSRLRMRVARLVLQSSVDGAEVSIDDHIDRPNASVWTDHGQFGTAQDLRDENRIHPVCASDRSGRPGYVRLDISLQQQNTGCQSTHTKTNAPHDAPSHDHPVLDRCGSIGRIRVDCRDHRNLGAQRL